MAENYPYVSALGGLTQVVQHLRKSLPPTVNSATLKRPGFAKANEGYVINILRFLGLVDEAGKPTDAGATVFTLHDDAEFAQAFEERVKAAYAGLFEDLGPHAWDLDKDALIHFFRQANGTSEITGKRQASTFQTLASFEGHGQKPNSDSGPPNAEDRRRRSSKQNAPSRASRPPDRPADSSPSGAGKAVGLTVRIEVNLPADGDQDTYDRIFRSIRENLLDE